MMDDQKRYDLMISGVGKSSGGRFNQVLINGQGTIHGDVDCSNFSISGVGTVEGNVKTQTGKISGKGKIKGDLKSDAFKVSGHSHIDGNVEVNEARFEGVVGIQGSVTAETLENNGVMKVKGDCNSEVFISRGSFSIGGLLNAGNMEVRLYAPCKAKEIGGENIKIHMDSPFSLRKLIKSIFPVLDLQTGLSAETIEGDEIYLEYTKAKVVRGNNVTIGAGCEIELVEYKSHFEGSDKSVVMENKKLD